MSGAAEQVFVCLDCEMTGLDLSKDRIIEVAVVVFTVKETLDSFETLIDPGCPIPSVATEITRITDDMVKGKPTIEEVLPRVLQMIGRHPLVGHGIKFDIDMLSAACVRANIANQLANNRFIDTLRMARLYGESPVNSLEQLGKHFNISVEGTHRAMTDVEINVGVFKYLFRQYKNLSQLYQALDKPILMRAMPLGKHKGRKFKDIPLQYLKWAVTKDFDQDLIFSLRTEIRRREKGQNFAAAVNPFCGL